MGRAVVFDLAQEAAKSETVVTILVGRRRRARCPRHAARFDTTLVTLDEVLRVMKANRRDCALKFFSTTG
jgi:hypothetical protein